MTLSEEEHKASHVKRLRHSIDEWAHAQGLSKSPEHEALAQHIVKREWDMFKVPASTTTCLLADYDGKGGYKNGRLVEWTGSAEEMIYPENRVTLEPVEEAVADVMLTLPHPDFIPEIS